jgi:hypothetical protein
LTDADRGQLAETFRLQALGASALGSPLYEDLCLRFADDVVAGGPTWTLLAPHATAGIAQAYPLRVLGGAHRMALTGDAPELARHLPSTGGDGDADGAWEALLALVADPPHTVLDALTRPPQTNEVGRSASMIGGFLLVANETRLPIRALEIGTSAGLNLRFDHYRYEQDDDAVGPPGSRVRFTGVWPNRRPPLDAPMTVVERRGCDVDPVDVTTADGRLTLLSYVWPDQVERFERLAAAIAIANEVPAPIDRITAPRWLDQQLSQRVPGVATVVFHSIMWQYLTPDTRDTVRHVLHDSGAAAERDAPLAWLRLEPDERDLSYPRLRLTRWPGGDDRLLAKCSFHSGPVDWVA